MLGDKSKDFVEVSTKHYGMLSLSGDSSSTCALCSGSFLDKLCETVLSVFAKF